jgi:hypothetical protein
MDAVKSAEQLAAEKQGGGTESKAAAPTSVSGLLGGFAKRAARKDKEEPAAPSARATFLTTSVEVVRLTTDVSAADVAIPTGFAEEKSGR